MEFELINMLFAPVMAMISYLGWSIRGIRNKVDGTMSEKQVRMFVTDKLDVVEAHHECSKAPYSDVRVQDR